MLATWAAEGHPKYKADEGNIAYISDVGAHLKPLFISIFSFLINTDGVAICAITAPGFVLSQAIDRFLRHKGRLAPNNRNREKWMSWLSMFFSTVGGIALILLSIFDVPSQLNCKLILLGIQSRSSSLVYDRCVHRLHCVERNLSDCRISMAGT